MATQRPAVILRMDMISEREHSPHERIIHTTAPSLADSFSSGASYRLKNVIRTYTLIWFDTAHRATLQFFATGSVWRLTDL